MSALLTFSLMLVLSVSTVMGTEVQFESYMLGYHSMRDLNEDANGYNNWSLHYREKSSPNGQFYNCSRLGGTANSYVDYEKDAVKQKLLEHEAIFKKQVYELHRLYRKQKDLMDDIRKKDLASSPLASGSVHHEDTRKWHSLCFPSNCGGPSMSGSEASNSPMKSLTGTMSFPTSPFPPKNGCTSKMSERVESQSSKVRRRLSEFTLTAENYIDLEKYEPVGNEPADQEHKVEVNLNNPIAVEETKFPAHHQPHTLYDAEIPHKELSFKSQCGSSNGSFINKYAESNGSRRHWVSQVVNTAGSDTGILKHALQSKSQEVLMHLPAHTLNQHNGFLSTDWTRLHSHQLSPWGRPDGNLTQKLMTHEVRPCSDSPSSHLSNFQAQALGNGMFGERWHQRNGGPDLGWGNKSLLDGNGFCRISQHTQRNDIVMKSSANIDLNRVLSDGGGKPEDHVAVLPWLRASKSVKDEVSAEGAFDFKGKNIFHRQANQMMGSQRSECSRETKILGTPIFIESAVSEVSSSLIGKSVGEATEGGRNMRMIDINLPCDQIPELSNASSDAEELLVQESKKPSVKISGLKCEIDLNSCADECEASVVAADRTTRRKSSVVIDLEAPACLENEEIFPEDRRQVESPQPEIENAHDNTIKIAAEVIVAISSAVPELPENQPSEDNLMWFASTVLEERRAQDFSKSLERMDYFESMTLKLTEMKDEEHLPQPLVPPEILKLIEEDAAATKSTATRRPQRRGRQKRDFQRDILPGLTSLSRHEVMEDMQTFGGLMRATGHSWSCGTTRRGSARGRPARSRKRKTPTSSPSPPVSSPPCAPPVNLTGWGKTRRPRRQRCHVPPAGMKCFSELEDDRRQKWITPTVVSFVPSQSSVR